MERCVEHDQQIVAIDSDAWSGETRFCTRDAWEYGWISGRSPWPNPRRGYPVGHPPDDTTILECECLCDDRARSIWGEMSKEGGRLRCQACVVWEHELATGRPAWADADARPPT
jgi:hypothetical protein